jgi:hypothetical protein
MKRKHRLPPVTATLNITLEPVTVAPVTPAAAYLGIAEALMPGAEVLASAPVASGVALTLVCAHVLECLLKAYLSKDGASEAELRNADLRHDLVELWRQAQRRGLAVDATPPAWVEQLSGLHNRPFHLRYPVGLHALVLPNPQAMYSGLQDLVQVVRGATQ